MFARRLRKLTVRATKAMQTARAELQPRLRKNAIAAGWCDENNFGDQLTPLLLKHYGLTPVFTPEMARSTIICVGSILDRLPQSFDGNILGSGLMYGNARKLLPNANILAVRGVLTRDYLGASCDVRLGDPAILIPRVFSALTAASAKRYALGIIPHYVDKTNPLVNAIQASDWATVKIIDVQRKPLEVVADICECSHIASSSLHGLIVAESLGIPSVWLTLSNHVRGGGFKFRDYYSAFGIERIPHVLVRADKAKGIIKMASKMPDEQILEMAESIDTVFRKFAAAYLSR